MVFQTHKNHKASLVDNISSLLRVLENNHLRILDNIEIASEIDKGEIKYVT